MRRGRILYWVVYRLRYELLLSPCLRRDVYKRQASYYTVLGPMPIGLIGMLPVLAVAVWLTLRQMKQEEKS